MYSKPELAEKIRKLVSLEVPEEDEDSYIAEMSQNIADPRWMDYIFHSDAYRDENGELDYDALCEKILAYKPIAL